MRQKTFRTCSLFTALMLVVVLSPIQLQAQALATDGQAIIIRRTIPYPQAVQRAPLTSDRLSTTSTRYIDARRGLRPYSTVYGSRYGYGYGYGIVRGYDDHFGISRAVDRPFSYSQRTLRTGVTRFTNAVSKTPNERPIDRPAETVRRSRVATTNDHIRIHTDKAAVPTTRGAVLVLSDGTVIQVGD